jgi:putative transposase
MIVGWQTATHLRTDLVLDALEMAVHLRRPAAGELVHHADRGSQPGLNRSSQQLSVREPIDRG